MPEDELTGVYNYRAKRETFFSMRLYAEGQEATFDIELVGIPPHHFEPTDGGPVGKPRNGSIFARQDQRSRAIRKMVENSKEPETYNEAARAVSSQVSTPDTPEASASDKLPALPEGDGAFDEAMEIDKPTLTKMAKREGKSTHGSKVDIARRLLNLSVE